MTHDGLEQAIAGVEEQFSQLYSHVKRGMRERALRVDPALSPLGFSMLNAIVRLAPVHARVLAETLELDKSIVSRQLRQLEELGLVVREADEEDRRAAYLVATPHALERVGAVHRDERRKLREGLGEWSQQDLEKLGELLARINELG
ncbi:MarR family winged helix-turn-helix transcriptional regulator [Microbacterium sp. STN6]|uniref:MarR family winged helix-turn-helix transcriptional regulator n=1 Tax=Microbacterium sp. STN6 TaxID=2995588 RepID=UPI00226099D5|nr:MarR family winged helix-turn-helix transcriptional regulator [Microbacterium sp. STN6]MCX7520784.1 MarR family winged helix-turn-helix transcriptional regulator [Microbacterium sp. STN6]